MRRLPVLATALACAAFAVAPAQVLAQGGAGDNQYQDPFGGGGSGGQSSGSSPGSGSGTSSGSSGSAGSTNQPALTTRPRTNLGSSGGGGSTTTTTTAPAAPSAEANGQLPNTGLNVPGIAALGLGLLVAGIGLRLRTADEQLF